MFKVAFGLILAVALSQSTAHAQAPGLSSMRVLGVSSTGFGGIDSRGYPTKWDIVPNGQLSTPSAAHSGPVLWVAVYEEGYSQTRTAKFNGKSMVLDTREKVYGSNNIVYGFINYWRLDKTPFTSGQFVGKSNSIKVPYREFSTSVNVR
ncbi:MAG: DUF4879 domain-containing protein [Planctomycetota bacterium]|nr:DUF4879 domain-containing protein [Planctomycetota bacterium]